METQKEKIMRLLNCSEEEAEDVIQTDRAIDKGEKTPYDLSPEAEKIAKKFAHTQSKATKTRTESATRKSNPTKAGIIAELALFLEKSAQFAADNVAITNAERIIAFEVEGQKYEITLTAKRAPKK